MALLACPECGGKVSDRATSCPHCGYPMSHKNPGTNICIVNGVPIDMTEILQIVKEGVNHKIKAIAKYRELTGCGVASAKDFVETLYKTFTIPATINVPDATISNARCPTCGSTDLTKITVTTRAIDGLFFGRLSVEGRAQFRCNKCGYQW